MTTITAGGYRAPEARRNPAFVFIGDSFTFGQGLSDAETFPAIFCRALAASCANLGVPGASTTSAIDRLEHYLSEEQWRPHHVLLFMLAMTEFMGEGNDLYDNLMAAESASGRPRAIR